MATQPEDIDLDPPAEDPENPVDPQDPEDPQDPPEDEEEIVFADDPTVPADDDSAVIRHLRAELKRKTQELSARPAPQPQPIEVGKKPDLWDDCEGDPDKFEAELLAWQDRQRQAEAQRTDAEKGAEAASRSFAGDVERFNTARATLKVPGAGDAIDTAISSLTPVQQAALVTGADNAAVVLAALGKHPGKLAELAAIENPIKFAVAVAKLEGTLKVQSRRKAPEPEQITSGNAGVRTGATDKEAERQEKRAMERGGDVSDLLRRNREARRAAQAKK